MSNDPNARLSKNERRQQARDQARVAREKEQKREKRNRLFLQGGVVLGVVAVLAVVGLIIAQAMAPAGPGPKNMASGGVIFGEDLQVVEGPALEQADASRVAPAVNRDELPLDVTVYVDYMCPACGNFETQHGTMLEQYVGSGDLELTVYPINMLDTQSLGTKYSSRAGNLMACVVEQQPEFAFALHNRLLSPAVQPGNGNDILTDDQLVEQAEAAGATANTELRQCVKDQRFSPFIAGTYKQVSERGIIGLAEGAQMTDMNTLEPIPADQPQRLTSTPTVLINGRHWVEQLHGGLEEYILKLKSELEGEETDAEDGAAATE